MATPEIVSTKANRSPALGGYAFDVIYLSDNTTTPVTRAEFPGGVNAIVLPGFEQDFIFQGMDIQAITDDAGALTAGACYATYDESSVVKYQDTASGHDPTILNVNVYVSSSVATLRIFVY